MPGLDAYHQSYNNDSVVGRKELSTSVAFEVVKDPPTSPNDDMNFLCHDAIIALPCQVTRLSSLEPTATDHRPLVTEIQ